MTDVKIRGDFITLAQLLKKLDFISSGGEAKVFLEQQQVLVNGVRESRRGKKLMAGDTLSIKGRSYRMVVE